MRSIQERVQRWNDLFDNKRNHVIEIVFNDNLPDRPFPLGDNFTERGDWALRNYELMLDQNEWLDTDRIPYLDAYTGTEIFAEAFGCSTYQPEGAMPHARYLIHNAKEAREISAPRLEETSLVKLFDLADRLREEAGRNAIFKLPDIQSPLGIAALIWEKTDFMASLILEPASVHHLAREVTKLVVAFFTEWTKRYGRRFIAHYPEYYMSEGITFSEDDVGIVDEKMFREFYEPEIRILSQNFGPLGIHCCAHAHHQWANFASLPALRVINLRIENTTMELDSYAVFKDCIHMNQRVPETPPISWHEHYPVGTRAIIRTGADSRDEALELADTLVEM